MDVLQRQMQHCNKYQNNQDLSHPSGSDILPIREKFSAWPPSPLVLLCCSVDSIIFYQCRQTIIGSLRESLILFSNSLPATHPARFSDTDNSKRTKNEKVSPNLLGCKILENCIFIRCCLLWSNTDVPLSCLLSSVAQQEVNHFNNKNMTMSRCHSPNS